MGWQVGLQAATLLAVGGVNGQIKEQTTVLAENLDALKNETIEGFSSVSEAINSLEASLISGIEDIKWFLGSIDNKLGKLVGLIEFSRATESTEQFKIGMELYKQEFYDKAKKCFEQSLEKNPLNLNAKAGLFLTLKELKKKKEPKILLDLVKLTSGDFLYHTKASQETKEIKTNYFINFCFAELLENKSYKEIINLYDNEISSFSKEYLPIKLKYVNAEFTEASFQYSEIGFTVITDSFYDFFDDNGGSLVTDVKVGSGCVYTNEAFSTDLKTSRQIILVDAYDGGW